MILTALLALTLAAEPKAVVTGPKSVPAGQVVFLDASASVSDKPIKWRVLNAPTAIVVPLDKGGRQGIYAILPNLPAGTHRVLVIAVAKPDKATEPDADADVIEVTVGGPPAPPPPPPPDPKPDGDKVTGKVYVTLYWDAVTDETRTTLLRSDPATRAAVEAQGGEWNTVEASTDAGRKFVAGWKPFWQAPFIVIQRPDGKVVRELAGLLKPQEIADAIKAVRP